MKIFIPKMYKKDIFSIDYDYLKNNNYKLIIFDLDNTIGSIKEIRCNNKTVDFLNKLSNDFIVIIASNSRKKRVLEFCKDINVDKIYFSLKPSLRIIRKIRNKYNIDNSNIVIIGDQILTDIFMGNRCGILTILVDPITNIDLKVTKFNRKIERIINKKNNIKRGVYY